MTKTLLASAAPCVAVSPAWSPGGASPASVGAASAVEDRRRTTIFAALPETSQRWVLR